MFLVLDRTKPIHLGRFELFQRVYLGSWVSPFPLDHDIQINSETPRVKSIKQWIDFNMLFISENQCKTSQTIVKDRYVMIHHVK